MGFGFFVSLWEQHTDVTYRAYARCAKACLYISFHLFAFLHTHPSALALYILFDITGRGYDGLVNGVVAHRLRLLYGQRRGYQSVRSINSLREPNSSGFFIYVSVLRSGFAVGEQRNYMRARDWLRGLFIAAGSVHLFARVFILERFRYQSVEQ